MGKKDGNGRATIFGGKTEHHAENRYEEVGGPSKPFPDKSVD